MDEIKDRVQELVDRIRDHDRSQLYENEESIGACPLCGSKVGETILSYVCEKNEGRDKGCSFVMWKDSSGRWFDRTTASRLLTESSIENLHGFFSRSGDPYEVTVNIGEDGKVAIAGSSAETSAKTMKSYALVQSVVKELYESVSLHMPAIILNASLEVSEEMYAKGIFQ